MVTQYDLELFQRIETALGTKLREYETDKEEVMILALRVGEAQRMAIREMKDLHEKRGTKGATLRGRRPGGGRKGKDDMDREEG